MQQQAPGGGDYLLGHAADELDRLVNQARFFGDLTEQVFLKAGLAEGMRVLDVGCGAGDVSLLAARIVGPEGHVTGLDQSPEALARARSRVEAAGVANVEFVEGDLGRVSLPQPVDAVVGRFVLMYLPDPAAALRHLARLVVPGGILVFQEMDASGLKSRPPVPLFDQTAERIRETFRRGRADLEMGLRLYPVFREAGLGEPQMILGARVEGGAASPAYAVVAEIVRTLLPRMEALGVATGAEIAVDTLAARLRDAVAAGGGVIVLPHLVGAWVRTAR